ncbi:MAG: phage tail protein [Nitrospirales bacterium]|nr:MAG: phage tail protein [Nitrospirales bacterium]
MHDFPVVFHFKVEIGLSSEDQDIRFQEVTGLSAEISTEEFREGGLNEYAHKLPTGAKYGNLVLKRGLVTGSEVRDWIRDAVENFQFEPRDVSVILLNQEHEPLVTWNFLGAYPVKWSLSDLKAQDNALAIESVELAYRRFRKG